MAKYILIFLFTTCIFQVSTLSQERKLIYDVMRNGKVIGKINFTELIQGQKKFLSMTSDVKTRYVLAFSDETSEAAGFDKGVMVYSSFHQKQTGSNETTKTTIASGKSYKLTDNGKSKLVSLPPIRYNMLLLYTDIPKTISKVYSANFQKMLDVKKIEENKYRLTLPDGKFNYYTYTNGICTKVEIIRSLFTLQFVLREK
ncbi:MAG TPA: DUF6134 family protein [Chitinophagaceae bacterium]|nr:DUF6134 family protein [Chitinophagaceae bacterium]